MAVPGLSEAGLSACRANLAAHVDRGEIPGLVALVARHDQAWIQPLGTLAVGTDAPVAADTIFRIASLTKPVTAVTAMTLVEDGTLALDAPIERWLPELADRRVLRDHHAELDDTVAAERPITVEDVLSFRLGFGLLLSPPDATPVQRAEADLELRTLGPPWPPSDLTTDEWLARFATLPLLDQPGQVWRYNTGAQLLGALIERATGQRLGPVMAERVFEPLGMVDTGFHVPAEKLDRFPTSYVPDPKSGKLSVLDPRDCSWWAQPPAMDNGAAWLVSTMDDFWAFVRMMVDGGAHAGGRILAAETVAEMTTDRLTAEQRAASAPFLAPQSGWGLGLTVPAADGTPGIPNGYGWEGGSGTTWRTDPERGLSAVLFTQRAMVSPEPPALFSEFYALAYAALED